MSSQPSAAQGLTVLPAPPGPWPPFGWPCFPPQNPWPWISTGTEIPSGVTIPATRAPDVLNPSLFDPVPETPSESAPVNISSTARENLIQIAEQIENALERLENASGDDARKARLELIQLVSYVIGFLDAYGPISSGYSVLQFSRDKSMRPEKVIRELAKVIREMLGSETRSAALVGKVALEIGKRVNRAMVGVAAKELWDSI